MGSDGSVERVLLLEPYGVASHRAWADGVATHSRFDVRSVVLPGERWRWRMRMGAVELAGRAADACADGWRPDVVLVSSMVDVAALLGLARRTIGSARVALYFHESQFAFPDPDVAGLRRSSGAEFASTHVTSMAAADIVMFNSAHHRAEAAAGVAELHLHAPTPPPVDVMRSAIVPVGIDASSFSRRPDRRDEPPLILWNHRWDHDKDPQAFFRALKRVDSYEWRLAVVGENVRSDPREFLEAKERFGSRIVAWGHVDRPAYVELLRSADLVCSTAVHEYFGVAMVEAMVAGAVPLLPDRLSYPEVAPEAFHDAVLYSGRLEDRLATALTDLGAARRRVDGLADELARRYDWSVVAAQMDALLSEESSP